MGNKYREFELILAEVKAAMRPTPATTTEELRLVLGKVVACQSECALACFTPASCRRYGAEVLAASEAEARRIDSASYKPSPPKAPTDLRQVDESSL